MKQSTNVLLSPIGISPPVPSPISGFSCCPCLSKPCFDCSALTFEIGDGALTLRSVLSCGRGQKPGLLFLVANIVTTSKALVTSSDALVTSSDALVTSSVLLLGDSETQANVAVAYTFAHFLRLGQLQSAKRCFFGEACWESDAQFGARGKKKAEGCDSQEQMRSLRSRLQAHT